MIIKHLTEKKQNRVLAIDADPNSNLNEVLGVAPPTTLGEIREVVLANTAGESIPGGMAKQEYMDFMFGEALSEEENFDLLVMGRTQGEGCYCFINGILRSQIDKYAAAYSHIVIDNEAGLEHISRGTLPKVDTLILISDCSRRGVQAAGRAAVLIEELELKPNTLKLIINRAPGGEIPASVLEEIKTQNLDLLGVIPQDDTVYHYDAEGTPIVDVPDESPIKVALKALIAELCL